MFEEVDNLHTLKKLKKTNGLNENNQIIMVAII